MRMPLFGAVVGLGFAVATSVANAAFVDFIEAANETDPVSVSSNLMGASITATAESASVLGFHTPAISPSPVDPGRRFAVLFEGPGLNLVSDYVLLTADVPVFPTDGTSPSQILRVDFFSEDVLLDDLLGRLGPAFAFGGGVEEDGTLQDLSGFLGTLPEGLIVRVQSDKADVRVPEPTSLLLLGAALAAMSIRRSRRATV